MTHTKKPDSEAITLLSTGYNSYSARFQILMNTLIAERTKVNHAKANMANDEPKSIPVINLVQVLKLLFVFLVVLGVCFITSLAVVSKVSNSSYSRYRVVFIRRLSLLKVREELG